MARDAEAAAMLRATLHGEAEEKNGFVPYRIAQQGLRVQSSGKEP
jgi:hypothetical protein